jgi:hypothetical protein
MSPKENCKKFGMSKTQEEVKRLNNKRASEIQTAFTVSPMKTGTVSGFAHFCIHHARHSVCFIVDD